MAGMPHLLLLSGLERQPIAVDDDDRRHCLATLREASLQQGVAVHAYALLGDRLRLLATPRDAGALGRLVQDFGRRYVGSFNRRHGRRGTLWDGRYRATVVQPGATALQSMLFVDTEPVRAGLVPTARDHAWSSAGHHIGRQPDPLVSTLVDYWQLGNTPFERESAYARRLDDGLSMGEADRLAEACHKGWAIGDATFIAGLAAQVERPLLPRRRGRPAKTAG